MIGVWLTKVTALVMSFVSTAAPATQLSSGTAEFQPAVRGEQYQVELQISDPLVLSPDSTTTTTTTTTIPTGPPSIIPGDCESVRRVFDYYDPSGYSSAFFVDQGIAYRETRCGLDTLNAATGDTGVVQLNPVHNRAGYFGGRLFGDGGWLYALHGLTTRHDTLNSEWANAAITLRQVCGNGPWNPGNYSCQYNGLIWPR